MKVFLDSIGCRLNQSEIEKLSRQFREAGHELVPNAAEADLVVVNTCAVTAAASTDSRKKIRSAARAGKARIVATGCYATIDPQTIAALPSVEHVFSNTEKDDLVNRVAGGALLSDQEVSPRIPLPGEHRRTRAFIKVQGGCDNFCTFCITRIARGPGRSVLRDEIYRDIESALTGGVKEIVLTGVNLGSWGRDFFQTETLGSLITDIIRDLQPPRIRLSSLEPWDVDGGILHALEFSGFCPHLHLPLQSGSDEILHRMARKITKSDYNQVVDRIREVSPNIALTTDIMVGFPGETDDLFEESLEFVRKMNFAGGHVFSFSMRPGTPAESLPGRVDPVHIKERSHRMREVVEISARRYRDGFLQKEVEVLWERSKMKANIWELSGLSGNYLPLKSQADENLYNKISKVMIEKTEKSGLIGKIIVEK